MALDPKELYSEGWWDEKNPLPDSITPPSGVDWSTGNYYAHFRINKDGSREIQWYKRGTGGGPDGQGDRVMTTTTDQLPAGSQVVKDWEAAQAKEGANTQRQTDQSERRRISVEYQGTGKDRQRITHYETGPDLVEAAPETASADPNDPKNKNEAELQRQREKNAAWPADQDPAYETDAERRKRAQDRIEQQGKDARQAQTDADAAAARNKPSTVATNTTEPYIVQAGPDGKLIPTPNPNYVGPKPTTSVVKGSDGRTYTVSVDRDGKATAAPVEGLPADTGGFAAEPSGAPPLATTYGAVTASLGTYRDFLNGQVQLYVRSNGTQGIPAAQADKLMAARLAQAEATIKEQQGVVDTQRGIQSTGVTQREQTLGETQSRRSAADSTFSTVMGQFMPLLKYLPPGSGETFVKGMQEMLGMGQHNAEAWGGLRETPEVPLGPAAAAANRAGPPAGGTFMAPYQSTVSPDQNAGQGTGEPPARGNVPPPLAAPAAPPALGGPGSEATQVVSHPDGRVEVSPPGSPPPVFAPPPPVSTAPPQQDGSFLDAYGRPQPHPDSEAARLINDPWMPNDLVAQAYQDVYAQPMPYSY